MPVSRTASLPDFYANLPSPPIHLYVLGYNKRYPTPHQLPSCDAQRSSLTTPSSASYINPFIHTTHTTSVKFLLRLYEIVLPPVFLYLDGNLLVRLLTRAQEI